MAAVLPLLLLVLALYFVILPQRRRAQAQRSLSTTLTPGDRVVTAGGMIGTLEELDGDRVRVEIANGVVIELLAAAIVRRIGPDVSVGDHVSVDDHVAVDDHVSVDDHVAVDDEDHPEES
ncbi:MAG: preprotein translocase subunit YajC [Acidimicrobiales bacterium]